VEPFSAALSPYEYQLPECYQYYVAAKAMDGKMSERSRRQYKMCIESLLYTLRLPVDQITTSHIRAYLLQISTKPDGTHLAAATMNQRKSIIRSFFAWLTEEEYLASLDGTSFEKAYIMTTGQALDAIIDTAGEYVYFVFTATESKTYTFQSTGSYDTYGYLYNSSQSQLSSNDDNGDGNNFKITRSMSAGETVYIAVRMYSSSDTGTFTVTVS
jgi:hypothetical protein